MTAADIGADPVRIGLKGSPTQVVKTFIPRHEVKNVMLEGNARQQARQLADVLASMNIAQIEPAGRS